MVVRGRVLIRLNGIKGFLDENIGIDMYTQLKGHGQEQLT